MKMDIVLAGVGGQGILSMAYILDRAAFKKGLYIKQAEVHGMSQRGGAVQSHLRISKQPIYSDLIPQGKGDMLLSTELLETLRYLHLLSPEARIISSVCPVRNIPHYPDLQDIIARMRAQRAHILIDAERLARRAGSARAQNMVMMGAAAPHLPVEVDDLQQSITEAFAPKGEAIARLNLLAFEYGKQAGEFYEGCLQQGIGAEFTYQLGLKMAPGPAPLQTISHWKRVFQDDKRNLILSILREYQGVIPGSPGLPLELLSTKEGELNLELFQRLIREHSRTP
ncbi:hypothetical protein CEE39_10255 [bacterium (candidate division B38) B3_B38]|nr:MAG: hypothetical protein CEE39_10255 [bacterium (candidate division B38) B3_B38]